MYRTKALASGETLVDTGEGLRPFLFEDAADKAKAEARVVLPRVARFKSLFQAASEATGVPAAWLAAIAYHETRGDETTVSRRGAKGLMAFMPAAMKQFGVKDPFDPKDAIFGAARYLRPLWLAGRSLPEAASGYEGGYDMVTNEPHKAPGNEPWGLLGAPSYQTGVTRLANSLVRDPSLLPDVPPYAAPSGGTSGTSGAAPLVLFGLLLAVASFLRGRGGAR